jgi:hypothetical protein
MHIVTAPQPEDAVGLLIRPAAESAFIIRLSLAAPNALLRWVA